MLLPVPGEEAAGGKKKKEPVILYGVHRATGVLLRESHIFTRARTRVFGLGKGLTFQPFPYIKEKRNETEGRLLGDPYI